MNSRSIGALGAFALFSLSGCGGGGSSSSPSIPIVNNGGDSGLAKSSWPKFHGGNMSLGRGGGTPAKGVLKWKAAVGYSLGGQSFGADGVIYSGGAAIDPATGTVKWKYPSGGSGVAAVGADGTVYLPSNNNLCALNAATGAVKWKVDVGANIHCSPAIGADGTVYFGATSGTFYALAGATGVVKWKNANLPDMDGTSPALGADGTIYMGTLGNTYALNFANGNVKWKSPTGLGSFDLSGPSVGPDGTVYVSSYYTNASAFNGATGSLKWTLPSGGGYSTSAVGTNGIVYIGGQRLYAVDAAAGSVKWQSSEAVGPSSPAIGTDGTVYVAAYSSHQSAPEITPDVSLYAFDGATGAIKWTYLLSDPKIISNAVGPLVSPSIGPDGVVYIGYGDHLFAIK